MTLLGLQTSSSDIMYMTLHTIHGVMEPTHRPHNRVSATIRVLKLLLFVTHTYHLLANMDVNMD